MDDQEVHGDMIVNVRTPWHCRSWNTHAFPFFFCSATCRPLIILMFLEGLSLLFHYTHFWVFIQYFSSWNITSWHHHIPVLWFLSHQPPSSRPYPVIVSSSSYAPVRLSFLPTQTCSHHDSHLIFYAPIIANLEKSSYVTLDELIKILKYIDAYNLYMCICVFMWDSLAGVNDDTSWLLLQPTPQRN